MERPGSGVGGRVSGRDVWVGAVTAVGAEDRLPWLTAAERRARREGCSATVVVVDDEPVGMILFTDELRTDTSAALRALRRAGVDRVVMVTGDRLEVAEPIGASLGIDQVFADRTPAEKLDVVRAESSTRSGITVMVGDGVNDAPALAAADLGVAMGARGATASSEAADVVLIVDRLDRLAGRCRDRQTGADDRPPERAARHGLVDDRDGCRRGRAAGTRRWGDRAGGDRRVGDRLGTAGVASAAVAETCRSGARLVESSAGGGSRTAQAGPRRRAVRRARSGQRGRGGGARVAPRCRCLESPTRWCRTSERTNHRSIRESRNASVGHDPLAAMSRTHQEIFHLASLLDRLVDDACVSGFGAEDRSEARRILYALDAILRLHFAQEEELLASITHDIPVT